MRSPTPMPFRRSTGRRRRSPLRSTWTPGGAPMSGVSTFPAIRGPATRSSGASCGNWKTGGTTERGSSGRRCACAAWATSRKAASTSKRRRSPERRISSTSTLPWRKRTRATSSRASVTPVPKASCSMPRYRSRTSSAQATRFRWRSTPARSTGRSRRLSSSHTGPWTVFRGHWKSTTSSRTPPRCRCRNIRRRRWVPRSASGFRSRKSTRSIRASASSTRT